MNEVAWTDIIFGRSETVVQAEAKQIRLADTRISEVLRRITNERGKYIHFSLTTLSITVWTHQMVQQLANIVHFQNNGRFEEPENGTSLLFVAVFVSSCIIQLAIAEAVYGEILRVAHRLLIITPFFLCTYL